MKCSVMMDEMGEINKGRVKGEAVCTRGGAYVSIVVTGQLTASVE